MQRRANGLIFGLAIGAAAGVAVSSLRRSERATEMRRRWREKVQQRMSEKSHTAGRMHHAFFESLGQIKAMGKNIEAIELVLDDGSHRMVDISELTSDEERGLLGKSASI